mmetsp:Transcript_38460/g.99906  ORF Transcript_38460/g.99906 Transcript_38460/m.99906 type:complete len:370 (+) Transcript_38460:237-1346(+)
MADDKGFGDPLGSGLRYERVSDINSGSFGFVQKCRDKKTGDIVAVKFVHRRRTGSANQVMTVMEREIVNHARLNHPFIIHFRDFFLLEDYLVVVMELADAGDLFDFTIKRRGLPEEEARPLFQQYVAGLEYSHAQGIVNRDVKPENTLLTHDPQRGLTVKICDFGSSKDQDRGSKARTKVGSTQYMAPEVSTSPDSYDGKVADMWSCGVMLYVMLMSRYPFMGPGEKVNPRILLRRMEQGAFNLKDSMSSEVKDLINNLLCADVTKRYTIEQVKAHPWYVKDLPDELKTINDNPPQMPHDLPSEEEVHRIIHNGIVAPPVDPNGPPPAPAAATKSGKSGSKKSGSKPVDPADVRPSVPGGDDKKCCVIC